MKRLLLSCLLLSNVSIAQTPGNVSANLTAWFKVDLMPNGDATAWTTTFPAGPGAITVTDVGAPYPQVTNTPLNAVSNYNKTMFFENNSSATLKAFSNNTNIALLQNNSAGAQGTFFSAHYIQNPLVNSHMMLYNNSPHAIQFRNLGAVGRLAIGIGGVNSLNASRDWTEEFLPSIISYKGNRSSASSMTAYKRDRVFTGGVASQSSGPVGLHIGHFPGNVNSPYNGYLNEFIFYNRDLTDNELDRVHTYLAVKYGITLDNFLGGTAGDYTATDSTIVWTAAFAPAYHNSVIGIARDDSEALLQKQSHSFTDNYRVYISNLETTNDANTGIFLANESYLMLGQNLENGCGSSVSSIEIPAGVSTRIDREWKATKTNFNQPFNLDIQIDTCTLAGSTVGTVDLANLRLLLDDDGDFTNASVYDNTAGLTFSYANGFVSIQGISSTIFPDNSTRFLTVGYDVTTVNFDGPAQICEGDSALITLDIQNASGPITFSYSDGIQTFTINNAVDGQQFYFGPTQTTTYTISGFSSFINCCGSAGSGSYTLSVLPYPTVNSNASDITLCLGDSTLLNGSGANNYSWDNGATNNQYISPIVTTTYTVIGTNTAGCADTASIQIVVNQLPSVVANATETTICEGFPVVLTGSGAQNYTWNNGVSNGVPFNVLSSNTYTVIGTDVNGCVGSDQITLTMLNAPNVIANASETTICAGEEITFTGGGAVNYQWNNGVTNNVPSVVNQSGSYIVVGTDVNGCLNSDTIAITVNPIPNINAIAGVTSVCLGDSTLLSASGGTNYQWSNGIANNSFVQPTSTTTYYLTGESPQGCVGSDSVTVTVFIPNINAGPDLTICTIQTTSLNASGGVNYVWNNGGINGQIFTPPTGVNTYIVIGTDNFGCVGTDTVEITVIGSPIPAFTPDVLSGNAPLTVNFANQSTFGGVSNWDFGNGSTASTVGSGIGQTTTYLNSGEYIVTLVTSNGYCEVSTSVLITVFPQLEPTIYVPNVFTPNGDEVNDAFFPIFENVTELEVQIVNRWGELVYQFTELDGFWDGKTNGLDSPDGVYFYYYKAVGLNKDMLEGHGFVTLVR